jgi:hypothetical protein
MRTKAYLGVNVIALTLTLAASSALAHHGWGGQGTETVTVSGTVHTAVSLAGPHATMQIRDDKGQVWDITLAPAARTDRAGLKADTIPVGATVTIMGKRNADPKRFEVKTARVTYNGKNFDVYPDRL